MNIEVQPGDAAFEEHVSLSPEEIRKLISDNDDMKRTLAGQTGTPAVTVPALVRTHVIVIGYNDFLSDSARNDARTAMDSGLSALVIGFGMNRDMLGDAKGREGVQYLELKKYANQPTCPGSFDIHNATCNIVSLTAGHAYNDTSSSAQPHQQAVWWNDDSQFCQFLADQLGRFRAVVSVIQGGFKVESGQVNSNRLDYFTSLVKEGMSLNAMAEEITLSDTIVATDEVPF